MSLAQASRALSAGEVSSLELIDAAIAGAQRLNPRLNAFLRIDGDEARMRARIADEERAGGRVRSPLHGIPMAHKDMFARKGVSSSCGSRLPTPVPTETATVLTRLDASGAVQIGVLNMSAFAVGPTGHNDDFGACRNPWHHSHITGGSSSGSGCAVAARVVLAALGSDTAGSVRIPAALCGVTGLKPTYGLVSRHAVMGMAASLDTVGPIAQDAMDCALLLDAIAVNDPTDPTVIHAGAPDFAVQLRQSVKGMRIGVAMNYFNEGVDAQIEVRFEAAVEVLRGLGATVVPVTVPGMQEADVATGLIIACEAVALHHSMLREHEGSYPKHMRIRLERGLAIPAHVYVNVLRHRQLALNQFVDQVFSKADVLLTPTVPITAPAIDIQPGATGADVDRVLADLTRFTRPFNYLGVPALSVPMGFSSTGLPLALQLAGRPFSEAMLLRLAHAYQTVTDWHLRAPVL